MKKILYVTQTLGDKAACGIGLMGSLIGKTLLDNTDYDFNMILE